MTNVSCPTGATTVTVHDVPAVVVVQFGELGELFATTSGAWPDSAIETDSVAGDTYFGERRVDDVVAAPLPVSMRNVVCAVGPLVGGAVAGAVRVVFDPGDVTLLPPPPPPPQAASSSATAHAPTRAGERVPIIS
jgi:hypothetical protein